MKARLNFRLLLVLAAALLLTACEGVTISQIKDDPARFRDKTVLVRGTVTTGFGLLSKGGYVVEDKTGSIFVITSQGVPSRGARVAVEGTVFPGANIGGEAVGIAIREIKHHID